MVKVQPAQNAGKAVAAIALHLLPAAFGKPFLAKKFGEAPTFVAEDAQRNQLDAGNRIQVSQ